jgi:Type II secretion system (T2SS), protein M subtype b
MTAILPYLKGRRAALAILAVGTLLLLTLIAAPVLSLFASQTNDLQGSINQLATYRAEIALRPLVESRLKDALKRSSTAPGLLHAANVALGAAEVESDFKSIVSANDGEIRSSQILLATKANGYEIVAIEYDLTVPMSRLRDLSYAVETHDPYLFIDHATISASQSSQSPAADFTLELRWTLRAYHWAGHP